MYVLCLVNHLDVSAMSQSAVGKCDLSCSGDADIHRPRFEYLAFTEELLNFFRFQVLSTVSFYRKKRDREAQRNCEQRRKVRHRHCDQ